MLLAILAFASSKKSFKVVGDEFQMDGQHFQYVAGEFHYFRQHPNDWEDTIKKMQTGGLNAIQTYIPWNLHEPKRGEFYFEGFADLVKFLDLCKKYNMYVLLRPGPYMCGEWDFGGMPYWITNQSIKKLRSSDPLFLQIFDSWFDVVLPMIKPFMYHNDGTVIMVQVENEYGFFDACDKEYLAHIAQGIKKHLGEETQLYTTDGAQEGLLKCGTIPEIAFVTLDYGVGANIQSNFAMQKKFNKGIGPGVVTEFYIGHKDTWTTKHNMVDIKDTIRDLNTILSLGGSVSFYMYFGGNNFGFWNGANGDSRSLLAHTTDYDFDGALDHAGDITYKMEMIRDVIRKYLPKTPEHEIHNYTKKAYGTVKFTEGISVYDALEYIETKRAKSQYPMTFDDLDLDFGYILYRTQTNGGELKLGKCHDRCYIAVDQKREKILEVGKEAPVTIGKGNLDILVENRGRICFGNAWVQKKGLPGDVKLDETKIENWENIGFNMSRIKDVRFKKELPVGVPAFYRATFTVDEVADTFLNPEGWTKGAVFINGFNLGRYWVVGPQLTLYVPRHMLKVGENELIIFEQESLEHPDTMHFDDYHQIDTI